MHVPLGRDEWYLCDETDKPKIDYVEFRGDEALALQWLDQFRSDVALCAGMRGLFDLPFHYEDSQIRQQIASRLARGVWRARRPAKKPIAWGPSREPATAPFALADRRAPTASRTSAPEASVFPDDVDFAAIAAAQKEAAELGVPFCEECARAALAGH
jgi:hypothetical protein